MSMPKCPKCNSTNVRTEKRINGDSVCMQSNCNHRWKTGSEKSQENAPYSIICPLCKEKMLFGIDGDKKVYDCVSCTARLLVNKEH